ncbi:MAG: 3-hydroxyacyl-ACP dehydratase FabZ [Candidatus Omnitrophica bacterium]|nr:3-hydroxyacyl-ACP dehydratase FabZ [Candidatus Omnitrophota bacterium]
MTDNSFNPYASLPLQLDDIKKLLPHREPFLFVDVIEQLTEEYVSGYRDIREDEYFFKGHFPGNPVMPGVLMVEALAQTLGVMVLSTATHRGKIGFFASIDKVKFRGIVRPGSRIHLEAKKVKERKSFFSGTGKVTVDGKVVCEAELMLATM